MQCTLKATNNLLPVVLFTDRDLSMNAAIQIIFLQTRHLLYIYHITKNIKKKARSKLHDEIAQNFIKDFYYMCKCAIVIIKKQFELRYNNMLTKYELYCSYFEGKLCPSYKSWAKYFIAKTFTAGIKLTQHIEFINSIKELVKVIEQELDKKEQYIQIKNYYRSNLSSVFISQSFNLRLKFY